MLALLPNNSDILGNGMCFYLAKVFLTKNWKFLLTVSLLRKRDKLTIHFETNSFRGPYKRTQTAELPPLPKRHRSRQAAVDERLPRLLRLVYCGSYLSTAACLLRQYIYSCYGCSRRAAVDEGEKKYLVYCGLCTAADI